MDLIECGPLGSRSGADQFLLLRIDDSVTTFICL